MSQPKAPKDAEIKRKGFYIMRNKQVAASVQPDGRGTQFIYLSDGRIESSARITGNITDEEMLVLLKTAEGFRKLVHSIGITIETDNGDEQVGFVLQMYGKTDPYVSGTSLKKTVRADGMEYILALADCDWSDDDNITGQIRFEFEQPDREAVVSVKLYLNDGYDAPEPESEDSIDMTSQAYQSMIQKSLVQTGNNVRLKRAIDKARIGKEVTIAFIGGSITQGAGAIPINTQCYARKTFEGLCRLVGKGVEENIHYVKAGVGGTPSELGMLRYERDVLRNGSVTPDIVIVEFAVNDAGDETNGRCYDSLVRTIYEGPGNPAVILLFSVFADDYNLQDRLMPVGTAYQLPMVSVKNSVTGQFYLKKETGRVVSKAQYFYDCFHPTNVGHTIMADCVIHLMKVADESSYDEAENDISVIKPPIGGEFQNIRLIDRSQCKDAAQICAGDFQDTDTELQAVEMDMDLAPTAEFPYNWCHRTGMNPFVMDMNCSTLVMIFKDNASPKTGCAEVYADGELVLRADPHINGWIHCNALICFEGKERKMHHVEVKMAEGDENKDFTILGFGCL
ncbi:MAG: SGNH/GDSL hydrolase family protein [Lachnospiraceae bacterium]|nr:SGNH/GDSL hydrolase family protein [Lachnospiraceae bacterium]